MYKNMLGFGLSLFCSGLMAGGLSSTLELTPVATGLSNPLAARHAGDGSGRLFIVEQGGQIKIFDGNQVLITPFLDVSTLTNGGGERGLLGLDFHPDYETNGFFYINYTNLAGDTIVARYSVSAGDPNVANAGSAQILLNISQDFPNHNGGDIHFGPDGFLYIGMGDGGSGGDPNDRAQSTNSLLGKMLRIDVDNPGANTAGSCGAATNYGIPADNPFMNVAGTCAEIWSLGLRNPFRFSFDANTGDMWIGDVGQGNIEEIDFEPANSPGGVNYGWRCFEGSSPFNQTGCNSTYTDPVLEYTHTNGRISVTGGYVYRGRLSYLQGRYFFGDFGTGEIFLSTPGSGTFDVVLDTSGLSSFGEDEDLNLYATNLFGGQLLRIQDPDFVFGSGMEATP